MLGREVVNLAGDFAVNVAGVEHQHFVFERCGFGTVKVPQLAGHGAGVEEVGSDGDHHVHIAGFDQFAAHFFFAMACAAGLRRHDKPGAARGRQVAVKVRDPQVVAVGDVFVFVHAGQAKGQAAVGLDGFGIDLVDVERRVGHHEVDVAPQRLAVFQSVRVVIEGVGFLDVALQPVHGQVHLGQADGGGGFFLAVKGDLFHGLLARLFDEVAALHEHAARAAGQIGHHAVAGFDDVDQRLHQRRWREKFAVVLCALHGELHQEIFVNAAKHITRGVAQGIAVKAAQQVFEQLVVKAVVVFGQAALQRRKVGLDRVHGGHQCATQAGPRRQVEQRVVTRSLGQQQGAALDEVGFDQRPLGHGARRLIGLDGLQRGLVTVGGVPQKNHAQHRHRIFRGREVGIGPKLIGGFPQAGFNLRDVVEGVGGH